MFTFTLYGQNTFTVSDYIPANIRYHTIKIEPTLGLGYTRALTDNEDLVRHEFNGAGFPRGEYFYKVLDDRLSFNFKSEIDGTIALPSSKEHTHSGYDLSRRSFVRFFISNESDVKNSLVKKIYFANKTKLGGGMSRSSYEYLHRKNIVDTVRQFNIKEHTGYTHEEGYSASINLQPSIGFGETHDISDLIIAYEVERIVKKYKLFPYPLKKSCKK